MAYFDVSGAVGKNKISYNVLQLPEGRDFNHKINLER